MASIFGMDGERKVERGEGHLPLNHREPQTPTLANYMHLECVNGFILTMAGLWSGE
jgi:hypothetical protein